MIGAQNLLCRLCLLARQFFDHQRLQCQHREQENQIAGKAEPAQNRKDDVGGNKRQRAQPHPQIKVVLFPENGGNNVRTGSVKDDDDEVEDKKCNKSEQTDKNDGTIMIDVEGEKVGQINGLVVYNFSRFSFGKPARITVQARIGSGEFVNIERETNMSGPIHTKGVLILQSLLANRFAKTSPLSLSASIVFEQSYGGVDGDSASSTEYYCLLSAVANLPIKQNIAVTGSINQFGDIQPIGGVNEKIEGFFDVCRHRGLTGEQGVIIPRTNVVNLMLREDVIAAVREGKFHIYAIDTVDDGIEILTGLKAGKPNAKGEYPKGTVNYLVKQSLENYQRLYAMYAKDSFGSICK